MAIRSQIDFYESKARLTKGNFMARIYHHYDGYPQERLKNIESAMIMVEAAYKNTEGFGYRSPVGQGDGSHYMGDFAAFYILANKTGAGNVEIDNELHGDIDYLYQLYPSMAGLRCRILKPIGDFWNETELKNMEQFDSGIFKELLNKYKEA